MSSDTKDSPSHPVKLGTCWFWLRSCCRWHQAQWDNQSRHLLSVPGLRCPELYPAPPPSYLRATQRWSVSGTNNNTHVKPFDHTRALTYDKQWQSLSLSGLCWWTWWGLNMAHESTANVEKHTVRLVYSHWEQEQQSTGKSRHDMILTVCIDWKRQ